jgi:hypothetical protein
VLKHSNNNNRNNFQVHVVYGIRSNQLTKQFLEKRLILVHSKNPSVVACKFDCLALTFTVTEYVSITCAC